MFKCTITVRFSSGTIVNTIAQIADSAVNVYEDAIKLFFKKAGRGETVTFIGRPEFCYTYDPNFVIVTENGDGLRNRYYAEHHL